MPSDLDLLLASLTARAAVSLDIIYPNPIIVPYHLSSPSAPCLDISPSGSRETTIPLQEPVFEETNHSNTGVSRVVTSSSSQGPCSLSLSTL